MTRRIDADRIDVEQGASVIVRSVHGLEWACAAEVSALIGTDRGVELSRRQVTFQVAEAGPELLGLRTADDVFLLVGVVPEVAASKAGLPVFAAGVSRLDWATALAGLRRVRLLPERIAFDVVVSLAGRHGFSRFLAEARIGAALAPVLPGEFLERDSRGLASAGPAAGRAGSAHAAPAGSGRIDPGPADPGHARPDLTVRVLVHGGQATVAVRLGKRPLHRRAYKVDTGPGTLHPPAAAAMVAIAVPAAGAMLDPFCGDGTIAIEAALGRPGLRILASDLNPERVGNARRNAIRAGAAIEVSLADAEELDDLGVDVAAVITNPPWNLAVDLLGGLAGSRPGLWRALPRLLDTSGGAGPNRAGRGDGRKEDSGRADQAGVLCCLTDADLGVPEQLAEAGWSFGLRQQLRLAGRVAHLVLAAPPGAAAPALPEDLASWRRRAIEAGIVTETGFS